MVNTVLAAAVASVFKSFSDAIEIKKLHPAVVASASLREHLKVVFNGNGYDPANQAMLVQERGLLQLDSGVESIAMMTDAKNVKLFLETEVFTRDIELIARQAVLLNHYVEVVKMEAECLLDIWLKYDHHQTPEMRDGLISLKHDVLSLAHGQIPPKQPGVPVHPYNDELLTRARHAREIRLVNMVNYRRLIEQMDSVVSADSAKIPPYSKLLFIDIHASK
jgi:glutamine synthetase type III